jgi:hypothetical protein
VIPKHNILHNHCRWKPHDILHNFFAVMNSLCFSLSFTTLSIRWGCSSSKFLSTFLTDCMYVLWCSEIKALLGIHNFCCCIILYGLEWHFLKPSIWISVFSRQNIHSCSILERTVNRLLSTAIWFFIRYLDVVFKSSWNIYESRVAFCAHEWSKTSR